MLPVCAGAVHLGNGVFGVLVVSCGHLRFLGVVGVLRRLQRGPVWVGDGLDVLRFGLRVDVLGGLVLIRRFKRVHSMCRGFLLGRCGVRELRYVRCGDLRGLRELPLIERMCELLGGHHFIVGRGDIMLGLCDGLLPRSYWGVCVLRMCCGVLRRGIGHVDMLELCDGHVLRARRLCIVL